jgi:hypothetical protein
MITVLGQRDVVIWRIPTGCVKPTLLGQWSAPEWESNVEVVVNQDFASLGTIALTTRAKEKQRRYVVRPHSDSVGAESLFPWLKHIPLCLQPQSPRRRHAATVSPTLAFVASLAPTLVFERRLVAPRQNSSYVELAYRH